MRVVVALGLLLGLIASGFIWAFVGSSGGSPALLMQPPAQSPSGWAPETGAGLGTGPSPSPPASRPVPGVTPYPQSTPRPAAAATRTASVRATVKSAVTATYKTGDVWQDGFTATVELVNTASTAQSWQVRLIFPGGVTVPDETVWNATKQGTRRTILFSGDPLQPGARLVFGFTATKKAQNPAGFEPEECTANGAACTGF
jgi:hypothetical protein